MNKKIKFIIPCLVVLITISVSIIISISREKVMTTNEAVSGIAIYVKSGTSYVSQSSVPTGSYYLNTTLSHCIVKGKIRSYNKSTGLVTYSFRGEDQCYLYFDSGTASMQSGNAAEEIINLAINDSTNLAYDDYGNVRYIGANPNNYACLSSDGTTCLNYDKDDAENKPAGLFRIIGVFNEDTHGVPGKQLVKLISADPLMKAAWDYKSGVGTAPSGNILNGAGSNDWSDSQLMYSLNGYVFMYNGYNGMTQLHTEYSYDASTYYISDGTYNIFQLYEGKSYLTGNGATSLNVPKKTTTSGYSSNTLTDTQTLLETQANMIASVTWHLGGCADESLLTAGYYTYERGTEVYSGHATTWIGKIGLMYPSDIGYATSNSACVNNYYLFYNDEDENSWGSQTSCSDNDWLVYGGARTGTQGTKETLGTITPVSSANSIYYMTGTEAKGLNDKKPGTSLSYQTHPTFYLGSDVSISGGSGTSTDPYIFVKN